ncbi:hypothetical protein DRO32_05315, partial [Candidatus Bathyarchaeota archaeon]
AEEAEVLRRMADMLRRGAVMLNLQCPACSSPLFRLRSGEIWCARCQKRVVVVEEGQDETVATSDILLGSLEQTLLRKLGELDKMMKEEEDLSRLRELSALLSGLLDNLERLRKMTRR